MAIHPVSPQRLAEIVASRIDELASQPIGSPRWIRVGLDGAPGSGVGAIATTLVTAVRTSGRAALAVDADDFWRPASLRLERGRHNPDSFYEDWYDVAALGREVLDPLRPGGTGRVLPSLWNAGTDRATRAAYRQLPPGATLVLYGPLLLGTGLDFELTVHFEQSAAALLRRLPAELIWTVPAYQRYVREVAPAGFADLVVRSDDPRHPALVEPD